jgi:hypothetical protein
MSGWEAFRMGVYRFGGLLGITGVTIHSLMTHDWDVLVLALSLFGIAGGYNGIMGDPR